MRGQPFIQTVFLAIILIVLAVPLAVLTRSQPPIPNESAADADTADRGSSTTAFATLRFVHPPSTIKLTANDIEVIASNAPDGETEWLPDFEVNPGSLNTIRLTATWAEIHPQTAVEISVEIDSITSQSQTFWITGTDLDQTMEIDLR